jgi:pimeloyl-ACP methyl ester carboxylesterase
VDLLDMLDIEGPIVAGFDWGARAAYVASVLAPERIHGLVSNGYNIFARDAFSKPSDPATEQLLCYMYYLQSERGRAGLSDRRAEFCRYLWHQWSPGWDFDEATFALTAKAFDNPDFVDVVLHPTGTGSGWCRVIQTWKASRNCRPTDRRSPFPPSASMDPATA